MSPVSIVAVVVAVWAAVDLLVLCGLHGWRSLSAQPPGDDEALDSGRAA